MGSQSRGIRWIRGAAVVLLIWGCSPDSEVTTPPPPNGPPVTPPPQTGPPLTSGSVTVNRSSVLLTGAGQTRQLTVQTANDAGVPVNAAVTWSSSAPDQVSVDASGLITARAIGSAMIFATSGAVKSSPVFIVVAEPQPGALLLNDAQVVSVGPPLGLAPGEVPTVGTQYEVRVSGLATAPAPGTVVLAAENATVAGKVVSTRSEAGAMVLTLAMARLGELLTRYDIDFRIDLPALPPLIGTGSGAAIVSGGVARQRASAGAASGSFVATPPISCDASLGPVLLDRKVQIAPTSTLKLDVVDLPGHTRRAIVGDLKLVGLISMKLNAGLRFTGKCELQLPIRVPVGGLLAVGVMPQVRLGVGVEVEGGLSVTAGEVSVTGEYGARMEVGWECGGAQANCRSLETVSRIDELKPKVEVFNPQTGMRVELSGQFYFLASLDAVFLTAFEVGILEAKIGPVQSADLGLEEDQADNPGYASQYDLKIEAVLKPGSGLQRVLDLIGQGINLTFQATTTIPISESPKGTLTVSKSAVGLSGETVDFRVDLNNTDYFLLGYNVVRVELWRKKPMESKFSRMRAFDITASNQSIFTYTWQPTVDDFGVNEFAAFVYTQFPVPGLEISSNSVKQVTVNCFSSAPRVRDATVAAANVCSDTFAGTARYFHPGEIQIDATVTWRRNPAIPEVGGDLSYIATGSATVKWLSWENKGCTVSQDTFLINGDDVKDSNELLVHYADSPASYNGLAQILFDVTVSCPGVPPQDYPLVMLWYIGGGPMTANKTVMEGRTDDGSGGYWEWRFARP